MTLIVFSQFADVLLTDELRLKLADVGKLVIIKEPMPLSDLSRLLGNDENKIIAIDPRYFDWSVPRFIIGESRNLKAVCLQTTSFAWIDVGYLQILNIPVTNLRGFSTIAVAEWATMMVLLLARRVPMILKDQLRPATELRLGSQLEGKLVGIIGMGRIGSAMALRFKGLGMNIQYWSRNSVNDLYVKSSLERLMRTSDVILPAIARNDETTHLLSDSMLESMKRDAIFVSVVPGVYNHSLMLEIAESGRIYGYGFESRDKPDLSTYKGNLWVTNELAWYTDGSLHKNSEQWVTSIIDAAEGRFPNRVN